MNILFCEVLITLKFTVMGRDGLPNWFVWLAVPAFAGITRFGIPELQSLIQFDTKYINTDHRRSGKRGTEISRCCRDRQRSRLPTAKSPTCSTSFLALRFHLCSHRLSSAASTS